MFKKRKWEIIRQGDQALIPINEVHAIIDIEDVDRVIGYAWLLNNHGYPYTRINRKAMLLHRHVLGLTPHDGSVVDHINHNVLDSRKSNLRKISHRENIINRKGANKNSKSGVLGVSWESKGRKWVVCFCGKFYGRFDNILDAAVRAEAVRYQFLVP